MGGLDSSQRAGDKTSSQEISDHLMAAGLSWTGSPGHMITYSPDKPREGAGYLRRGGSRTTDCRGGGWQRFQPSDMGRIGASQGRRGRFSPGGKGPVEKHVTILVFSQRRRAPEKSEPWWSIHNYSCLVKAFSGNFIIFFGLGRK